MKQLLDFLPILLFFGAFKMYDIYVATAVIMIATSVQMLILLKLDGKLQTMHKVTWALVVGFGALTLAVATAFAAARKMAAEADRIIIFGSFLTVAQAS